MYLLLASLATPFGRGTQMNIENIGMQGLLDNPAEVESVGRCGRDRDQLELELALKMFSPLTRLRPSARTDSQWFERIAGALTTLAG